jgi:hypothetical protein
MSGYGSRFADGGEGPTAADQDLLRINITTPGQSGTTPTISWNVNMQTGLATPSGNASPITFTNFENASVGLLSTSSLAHHTLIGNAEANYLEANTGNDTLKGFGEDDELYGAHGDDLLEGGDGDDVLYASYGSDTLTGGPGVDEFWCKDVNGFDTGGTDLVTDNVPGEELHSCPTSPGALLPDATIRRSNGDPVGDGVYEVQPSQNQTMAWSAKKGKSRTFVVGLEYDGTGTSPITVDGCADNSKFAAKYLDGAEDVTDAVADGTYLTDALGPDEEATLDLKIKAKKDRGTLKCDTSAASGGEVDAVRATLKAKP